MTFPSSQFTSWHGRPWPSSVLCQCRDHPNIIHVTDPSRLWVDQCLVPSQLVSNYNALSWLYQPVMRNPWPTPWGCPWLFSGMLTTPATVSLGSKELSASKNHKNRISLTLQIQFELLAMLSGSSPISQWKNSLFKWDHPSSLSDRWRPPLVTGSWSYNLTQNS